MHTLAVPVRSTFPLSITERGLVVTLRTVALVALLSLFVVPAWGQTGFPGAPNDRGGNVRLYPLELWSPRVGIGLGAGFVTHNLWRRGSQTLLTLAPARHEQVATFSVASGNPRRARQYVLFDARGLHTDRQWFYGLGPSSPETARTTIGRSALRFRLRVGQSFLEHRLLLQPHVELSLHRVDHVPPLSPTTSLDARSQSHLDQLTGETERPGPRQSGLRLGFDVRYDTRNRTFWATRGALLQSSWTRYHDVGSSFVHFDQFDAAAYGYVPLVDAHRLVGRLSATVTHSRGDAPVPFYMLPTLGGPLVPGWNRSRFVASDRLIASTLYRFPLVDFRELFRMEGHVGLHAANVYGNLFSDAAVDLSFDQSLAPDATSIPLRPAASVGLRVGTPFRHLSFFDFAVGLSPEGVSAVRFTFQRSLQAVRRPHHSTSALH